MTDPQATEDKVRRLIIRGDGSFSADPKGDWVAARHYDAERTLRLQAQHERDCAVEKLAELKAAVRNARLTWAMVCPCPCDACDTFYEALKLTSGDVPAECGKHVIGIYKCNMPLGHDGPCGYTTRDVGDGKP
jgi:hypothetical protein